MDRVDRVRGLLGFFPMRTALEQNTQTGLHPVHPVQSRVDQVGRFTFKPT